jgi:hypothetical protein
MFRLRPATPRSPHIVVIKFSYVLETLDMFLLLVKVWLRRGLERGRGWLRRGEAYANPRLTPTRVQNRTKSYKIKTYRQYAVSRLIL